MVPPLPVGEEEEIAAGSLETTNSLAEAKKDTPAEGKTALEERIKELETKLWEQTAANAELRRTKEALTEEIMELTKALFEEANGMVAEEAKARAKLEAVRRKLETELEATKEQLRLEKQQLHELRGRFGATHSGLPFMEVRDERPRASSESGQISPVGFDKSELAATLIRDYGYFPSLLPKHRFESRHRFDGATSAIWDRISERIAKHDLIEFSRFVERCSNLDSISMLSHPFVKEICETDVGPCLQFEFKPKAFVRRVCLALLRNTCSIENLPRPNGHAMLGSPGAAGTEDNPSSPASLQADVQMGSVSAVVLGGGSDSPKKASASLTSDASDQEGGMTVAEDTSKRLRGIMSQFASSVTSLPEVLLSASGAHSPSSSPSLPGGAKAMAKFCALCGLSAVEEPEVLEYRLRLNDGEGWMFIDGRCRERLVAAGHFFTFLRHLRHGLYSNRPLLDLFYDLLHYRRCMFYARMATGATMFFIQSDLEIFLDHVSLQASAESRTGATHAHHEPSTTSSPDDGSAKGSPL